GRGYYGRTRDAAQGEERRSPKRVRGQTVWRWQAGLCLSQGAVVSWAHPNWTVASTASLDSQTPAGSPSLTTVSWAVEWRPSLQQSLVTDKFTESVYVLANEPSVALYRLQEHVRRSLPELAQHKADMQRWEEQSQGAIYTVEYACSPHHLSQEGVLRIPGGASRGQCFPPTVRTTDWLVGWMAAGGSAQKHYCLF
uniref:Protein MEF2BNB n=1 Tax=Bos mutus grunniens TaxID=30521 RepID=A0A8B9WC56_BOSMU